MGAIVTAIFIVVPLAELALLIAIGSQIGVLPTIALVVSTAVIGLSLIRHQGMGVLVRARQSLDRGEMPVAAVLDGVCLLIAGAFLLTPGLLTDTAGFLLLMPPVRRRIANAAWNWLTRSGRFHVHMHPYPPRGPQGGAGPIIEGEFERVEPQSPGAPDDGQRDAGSGPSGWRGGPKAGP